MRSPVGNFVAGALTVNPAHLTVTADPKTKVLNAANASLTYVVSGFRNGETAAVVGGTASCSTTATAASPGLPSPGSQRLSDRRRRRLRRRHATDLQLLR